MSIKIFNRRMAALRNRLSLQLLFSVFPTWLVLAGPPTITPSNNRFVPVNSTEDVTYSCSAEGDVTVFWEIDGSQITNKELFATTSQRGVSIMPMHTNSTSSSISISQMARRNFMELSILCLSMAAGDFRSIRSHDVDIIAFDVPTSPRDMKVSQATDSRLDLEWDRPSNMPYDEVNITYYITISSTEERGANFLMTFNTTDLSLSINISALVKNSSACELFQFSIYGLNLAGTGRLSTPIIDTIPVSPDVRNITEDLTVDSVALDPLTIAISFPYVDSCSVNFTLRNYSIEIDDQVARVLPYDEANFYIDGGKIRLKLNATYLPAAVGLDSSHNLTVTVCHDINCKTSNALTFNTTDVQWVNAIFYENKLYLRCFFANDSLASGCLIKLLQKDSNETEEFEIDRVKGYACNMTKNQREAYSGFVVLGIDANGMEGNTSLSVSPIKVDTMEEYLQKTECEAGPPTTDDPSASTAGAIAGGVVGSIVAVAAVAVTIIVPIIVFIVYKRHNHLPISNIKIEETKSQDRTGSDSTDSDLVILYVDVKSYLNKNTYCKKTYSSVKLCFSGCCIEKTKGVSDSITVSLAPSS